MRTWIELVAAVVLSARAAAAAGPTKPLRVVVTPIELGSSWGQVSDDTRVILEETIRRVTTTAADPAKLTVLSAAQTAPLLDARTLRPDQCTRIACQRMIARAAHADAILSGRVYLAPNGLAVQMQLDVLPAGEFVTGDPENAETPDALSATVESATRALLARYGQDLLGVAFPEVVAVEVDTYRWGVLTASIQPRGADVLSLELGSPQDATAGVVIGYTHGLTNWLDVGLRLSGELSEPSSLRVPIRLRIVQGEIFAFTFHVDPGVYWNLVDASENSLPSEQFYFDTGLQFGFRMTPRAELSFGFDGEFWDGTQGTNGIAVLTYTSFEYTVTRRVSVGIKTGFGVTGNVDNGASGVDVTAELTFGLRL